MKRLYTLFQFPYSTGSNRHCAPLRLIHFTASTNRRQACSSLPRYAFGSCFKKSRIFAHCLSVSLTSVMRLFIHHLQCPHNLAVEAITQAQKLNPSFHKVLSLRGCILCDYARNQNDEPKHLFVEAIENFQQSSSSITAASYHYNIGNCYAGLSNHQKAVEEYDLALADAPPPE